mgnify:CR=1 FL=1
MSNIYFTCSNGSNFDTEAMRFKNTVGIDHKKLYKMFGEIVPFNYSKFVISNNFVNRNFLIIYKDYNNHVLLKVSIRSCEEYRLNFNVFGPSVTVYDCDESILGKNKEYFRILFEKVIGDFNMKILTKDLKTAGLTLKKKYTINVVYHSDRRPKTTSQITGTFGQIFKSYTNMNDRLRYCNGCYYKFENPDLEKAYHTFLKCYKGNFFLDCAVARGALID